MASRGLKRRRFEAMKNDISVEMHNLTNDSGDYNNDIHAANEEFKKLCKGMAEKQYEFLTRSLLLEEKYGDALAVLEVGKKEGDGNTSGQNVLLPTSYAEDVRKFVNDARVSLDGHGQFLAEEYAEMEMIFEKYTKIWSDNMKEMRERAEHIAVQRANLSRKLSEFSRYSVDDNE